MISKAQVKKLICIISAAIIVLVSLPLSVFVTAAAPVFDSSLHTDYTEKMSVTRNNVAYTYKGSINENSKSGTNTYKFITELSNDTEYYFSFNVKATSENSKNAGVRIILREGSNSKANGTAASDRLYVEFDGNGVSLVGTSNGEHIIASDTTIKRALNTDYKITVLSQRDKISLWINDKEIFSEVSLVDNLSVDFSDMPTAPMIAIMCGDGSGRRASNITVSSVGIWGEKIVQITDEPQFDPEIHTDYANGGEYDTSDGYGTYDGQPITETGKSGIKSYTFRTAMTPQSTYVFTAEINSSNVNTFWSGVRFSLRSGNNHLENGVTGGEIFVIFRNDGLYLSGISNGEKTIASNTSVKRVAGYTYRITVKTTPDKVSVWIDGQKVLEDISLIWTDGTQTVDFTALPANPKLNFTNGNGESNIQTVSTAANIKIFNDPCTDNPADPDAEPVFDAENHKDYTADMKVVRDGVEIDKAASYTEAGQGTVNYYFETELTKKSIYYYTATVCFTEIYADWATPQLIMREGRMSDGNNDNIQLAFRTGITAVVNNKGSGISKDLTDSSTHGNIGRKHRLTVKSEVDKLSVWIDGKLVFKEVSLDGYSNLNSAPGIRFMLGNGPSEATVSDIKIWNNGTTDNPPNEYDPTDEPIFDSQKHVDYSAVMQITKNEENYTAETFTEKGEAGDINYSFKTALTNLSTYYMTYYVDYESIADSWTVPHIMLRSGVKPNGEYDEIYLSIRTNGLVITNMKGSGLKELTNFDFKAQAGKTYKITVKCSPDKVSVWLNKALYFYDVNLLDYSGLYSTPNIKFRLGNKDTSGESASTVRGLKIWNNGTDESPANQYKPTDEPMFNPETDTDYTLNMTAVDKNGNSSKGKKNYSVNSQTDVKYTFETQLGRNAIYYYTADICIEKQAEEWASPHFILRSGTDAEGNPIYVGVLLRTNCVGIIGEDMRSISQDVISYEVRATVGKPHRLTARCEADKISVWFDGRLIIYNGSLSHHSNLKATPGIYFQCGNYKSQGTSDIRVSNITIWNKPHENISAADHILFEDMVAEFPEETAMRLTDAEEILASETFYNNMSASEKALVSSASLAKMRAYSERIKRWLNVKDAPSFPNGAENMAEAAAVLKNGKPYLPYSNNSIAEKDASQFGRYVFENKLPIYSGYYYSGTALCTSAEESWQRPRIVFRGNDSHKLSVAFLEYGVYVMDNDSKALYKDTVFKMDIGKEYDFVIYSDCDSFSLWVNGILIFGDEPLDGEWRNLPIYSGITFAQAAGKVSNIKIWSETYGADKNATQSENDDVKHFYLPVSVKGGAQDPDSVDEITWEDTNIKSVHHMISSLRASDEYLLCGKLSGFLLSTDKTAEIVFRGSEQGEKLVLRFDGEKAVVYDSNANVLGSEKFVVSQDKTYALQIKSSKDKFSVNIDGETLFVDVAYNIEFNQIVPALSFNSVSGKLTELELSLENVPQQTPAKVEPKPAKTSAIPIIIAGSAVGIIAVVILITVRRKRS